MNDKMLRDLYGLKYNPFEPDLPAEDLWEFGRAVPFLDRMNLLVRLGGFGLVTGMPGTGKSKLLQLLAARLEEQSNVVVGVMERPQSQQMDFYRELGTLFGVRLSPANRYGGFQALRQRWREHIKASLMRPALLIDEAQEMPADCLNEVRILGSVQFDSQCLLTTVLCGDNRLEERLKSPALMPLHSRVRAHLSLDGMSRDDMRSYLCHALEKAGAPQLMSEGLMAALADHAEGNLRRLNHVAGQLIWAAAQRKLATLDENLFLDLNVPGAAAASQRGRRAAR